MSRDLFTSSRRDVVDDAHMWFTVGGFDSETDDINFSKWKALRPGKTYGCGRRDQPLVLRHPKVSKLACEIIVGDYTVDNVSDPSFIPTLEVVNRKAKGSLAVGRGGDQIKFGKDALHALQDMDIIHVVSEVSISVRWVPICIYVPSPKPSIPLEGLASMGISLTYIPNTNVTHHVTPIIEATPSIAASLISGCTIVKPQWLDQVEHIASLPADHEESWERVFHSTFLSFSQKYHPPFGNTIAQAFRNDRAWQSNESRLHLFNEFRFICVGEKLREIDSQLRLLIERGEGAIDTFNVHDEVLKFRKTLSRGVAKERSKVIAVADAEAMISAVGKDKWAKMLEEAAEFQVGFISAQDLVDATLKADTEELKEKSSGRATLSQSQSNDESMAPPLDRVPVLDSPPAPTRRKLPRRAASRQPSQEPNMDSFSAIPESVNSSMPPPSTAPFTDSCLSVDTPEEGAPGRRKLKRRIITQEEKEDLGLTESTQEPERRPLTRRGQGGVPVVTGLDDNSVLLDASPDLTGPPPESETPLVSLPAPRSKRTLKRRRETIEETLNSQFAGLEPKEEPAYKKHKALFDALEAGSYDEASFSGSQTQSGATQEPTGRGFMATLHEEEEESQSEVPVPQTQVRIAPARGQKRKAGDEDVEMAQDEQPAKKRAMESNHIERLPTTVVQAGQRLAPPPSIAKSTSSIKQSHSSTTDVDAAFLKAIASTKKGKKAEDEFDREFNNLKISKPDLESTTREAEWKVLDDFGGDFGVRGNFMVVVEMEVFRPEGRDKGKEAGRGEWNGIPNFKKFKKKGFGTERTKAKSKIVDLTLSGPKSVEGYEQEFPPARTHSLSNSMDQDRDMSMIAPTKATKSRAKAKGKAVKEEVVDQSIDLFDSDEQAPPPPKTKPTTRKTSVPPPVQTSRSRSKVKTKPLFIEDEEDDYVKNKSKAENDMLDLTQDRDEELEDLTLRTFTQSSMPPPIARRRRVTPPAPKKNADAVDVSDDEEIVVPKRRSRRR